MSGLTRDLGVGVQAGLVDTGLLWALNQFVLHGQGYEIRADAERLLIAGYGAQVLSWPDGSDGAVDVRWRQYRQTLLDAQRLNNPGYWENQPEAKVRTGVPGRRGR